MKKTRYGILVLVLTALILNVASSNPTISSCRVNETVVDVGEIIYVNASTLKITDNLDKFWINVNDYVITPTNAWNGESYLKLNTSSMFGNYTIKCFVNDTGGLQNSSLDGIIRVRGSMPGGISSWNIQIIFIILTFAIFFTWRAFSKMEHASLFIIAAFFWYILGSAIERIKFIGFSEVTSIQMIYFGDEWMILKPLFYVIGGIMIIYSIHTIYSNIMEDKNNQKIIEKIFKGGR